MRCLAAPIASSDAKMGAWLGLRAARTDGWDAEMSGESVWPEELRCPSDGANLVEQAGAKQQNNHRISRICEGTEGHDTHTHSLSLPVSLSLLLRSQHGEEMSRDFASQSNQGTFQV